MGDTIRWRTSGFKEFEDALLELSTQTARRYARKALEAAGDPILAAYQAGTTVKTGVLLDNENEGLRKDLTRNQKRTTPKPKPSEVVIHIGSADPAAMMEEFGINQAPNPALTRAWDQEGWTKATDRIGESLGAQIEKQARRAKKKA
jgi:hypothetical protein